MELKEKLAILADAAKYDASCASSGSEKRNSLGGRGIGSTESMGICHSYAPDGRCISLLKLLLTNYCTYDCLYCVNRASSNVQRARFSVAEVVALTLDFYRRNYIEGLFLSSGIIRTPDYTMEQVIEVARRLREEHDFRGYIHLKTIPDASDDLLKRAGRYADRLSINVELPSAESLARLAPEKNASGIRISMARLRVNIDEAKAEPGAAKFAAAGQSTQLIVGADASTDGQILDLSENLYGSYRLKRVYYSAFSPIPDSSARLPLAAAPLIREHRLYQADWLMRFYGFSAREILPEADAMLRLEMDPKLAWALANRATFPIDLNRASKEVMLRVPGLGLRNVSRILSSRRQRAIRCADLTQLRINLKKILPFVVLADHRPAQTLTDDLHLERRLARSQDSQLDLFAAPALG